MTEQDLYLHAKAASLKAYSPYSGFRVGAAVLTAKGRLFTGCNIENSSYGATCCAERVALFKAVSEGEKDFSAIAVYGGDGEECVPCGICLQVIAELAPNVDIILEGNKYKLMDLLPKVFTIENVVEKSERKEKV